MERFMKVHGSFGPMSHKPKRTLIFHVGELRSALLPRKGIVQPNLSHRIIESIKWNNSEGLVWGCNLMDCERPAPWQSFLEQIGKEQSRPSQCSAPDHSTARFRQPFASIARSTPGKSSWHSNRQRNSLRPVVQGKITKKLSPFWYSLSLSWTSPGVAPGHQGRCACHDGPH